MSKLLHAVQTIAGKLPHREAADLEVVRRLLTEPTNLEEGNDEGWTAFMWAVRCELDDVARLLADAGADTSHRHDAEFIAAAFSGDGALARTALSCGANTACRYAHSSPLEIATFHGSADVVEALILAGAAVPTDALSPLGEMDITDYKIDPAELEPIYARTAELLLTHGASASILAYNGQPLISTFPVEYYPTMHRVLSAALTIAPPPDA